MNLCPFASLVTERASDRYKTFGLNWLQSPLDTTPQEAISKIGYCLRVYSPEEVRSE